MCKKLLVLNRNCAYSGSQSLTWSIQRLNVSASEQIALIEAGVADLVNSTFVDGKQCIFLTRVPEDEADGNYVYVEDNDGYDAEAHGMVTKTLDASNAK